MRVLVIGAHGQVGRHICRLAAARGHEVTGMVRRPDQHPTVVEHGATPRHGDLEAEADLDVAGHDVIVFAAGAGAGSGDARKETVDFGGAVKAVDAAIGAGVTRFIMVSARRVDAPEDAPESLRTYLAAKARADAYLRSTDRDWTIVRPGRLSDAEPTGAVELATDLESHGEISREDTAALVVACIDADNTIAKTFEALNGPIPVGDAVRNL